MIITLSGIKTFIPAFYLLVEKELSSMANTIILSYDNFYPGDYELVGETYYELKKGNNTISNNFEFIDQIKKQTNIDITIFYQDTRILTTIRTLDGNRIVGTGAHEKVISEVLENGHSIFFDSTVINDEKYFAYYRPIQNSDGTIVGMIFVGQPLHYINKSLFLALTPIVLIAILCALVIGLFSSTFINNIFKSLQKLQDFITKISVGNLSVEMNSNILKRNDELSDIGYSAVKMQRSLRILIEQDALTELFNRRYGDIQLKKTQLNANSSGSNFALVLGDIDFFKRINDTYGHDCGDAVLKRVAFILKNKMVGKGHAIRWGGEEFLLIFNNPNYDYDDTIADVEDLLNQVREATIIYDKNLVRVTMTFGIVKGDMHTNITTLLREVDNKLYFGKTNGRNQIVP